MLLRFISTKHHETVAVGARIQLGKPQDMFAYTTLIGQDIASTIAVDGIGAITLPLVDVVRVVALWGGDDSDTVLIGEFEAVSSF